MENNENFVEQTENVEQTTEQTPKTYTQEEVDAMMGKRVARTEAKIRKEYDRKYGQLEEVLKAGTGKQNVDELTDTFRDFYQQKGIKIRQKPTYSDHDIEVLAGAEADEIIRSGFDEVVEEVDRLTNLGAENMTAREKALFRKLATHRQNTERGMELTKLGVSESVYNSDEFKNFAARYKDNIPITDIYEDYRKITKKEFKNMGSMKNNISADSTVKDFYTRDEALRFTKKDFDNNPALFAAVERSMMKW
jgi:hypothetical protein